MQMPSWSISCDEWHSGQETEVKREKVKKLYCAPPNSGITGLGRHSGHTVNYIILKPSRASPNKPTQGLHTGRQDVCGKGWQRCGVENCP